MSDRDDIKFWIGLALVLFGPGYASQLENQASQQTDPRWRDFYLGSAQILRRAAKDPKAATDALEDLWNQIFGQKPRRRTRRRLT